LVVRLTCSYEEHNALDLLREDGLEEAGWHILTAIPDGVEVRVMRLAHAARCYEEGVWRLEEAADWYAQVMSTTTTITEKGVIVVEYPTVRNGDCASQRLDFTPPEGDEWSELYVLLPSGNFRIFAVKRQREIQSLQWGVYGEDGYLIEGGLFYRDSALDCAANLR